MRDNNRFVAVLAHVEEIGTIASLCGAVIGAQALSWFRSDAAKWGGDATEYDPILLNIRNIDQPYQVYRDRPASPHI